MEITPHNPHDALTRRKLDKLQSKESVDSSEQPAPAQVSSHKSHRSETLNLDPAEISRYVDILKQMDPSDLHRIDDLRQRIEDGSYQAEVDNLIDPLLAFLGEPEGS